MKMPKIHWFREDGEWIAKASNGLRVAKITKDKYSKKYMSNALESYNKKYDIIICGDLKSAKEKVLLRIRDVFEEMEESDE